VSGDIVDSGELATRRTAETIAEWFDANGGYDAQYRPGEWKVRAQQALWRMHPGLLGDAAGLQWAAVIDKITPIVEDAMAHRLRDVAQPDRSG
jgi:hypothetical protein